MITCRFDCFQVENLVLTTKTERIKKVRFRASYSWMDRHVFLFQQSICLFILLVSTQSRKIYKNTFKSNFLQPIWLKFHSCRKKLLLVYKFQKDHELAEGLSVLLLIVLTQPNTESFGNVAHLIILRKKISKTWRKSITQRNFKIFSPKVNKSSKIFDNYNRNFELNLNEP